MCRKTYCQYKPHTIREWECENAGFCFTPPSQYVDVCDECNGLLGMGQDPKTTNLQGAKIANVRKPGLANKKFDLHITPEDAARRLAQNPVSMAHLTGADCPSNTSAGEQREIVPSSVTQGEQASYAPPTREYQTEQQRPVYGQLTVYRQEQTYGEQPQVFHAPGYSYGSTYGQQPSHVQSSGYTNQSAHPHLPGYGQQVSYTQQYRHDQQQNYSQFAEAYGQGYGDTQGTETFSGQHSIYDQPYGYAQWAGGMPTHLISHGDMPLQASFDASVHSNPAATSQGTPSQEATLPSLSYSDDVQHTRVASGMTGLYGSAAQHGKTASDPAAAAPPFAPNASQWLSTSQTGDEETSEQAHDTSLAHTGTGS